MKPSRLFAFTVALFVLPLSRSSADVLASQQGPDFNDLGQVALAEMKEMVIPGAVVAVVSGDRVIHMKAIGISNLETNTPVASDMLFRSGSTGKIFTAALLVTLAEEGKLRLDEPIGKYIKGLGAEISQLTAHQILTHTAGLKDEGNTYGSHDESALARTVGSWKGESAPGTASLEEGANE
jgi:CubicO group peptidase (beta-lactamase class C family)